MCMYTRHIVYGKYDIENMIVNKRYVLYYYHICVYT